MKVKVIIDGNVHEAELTELYPCFDDIIVSGINPAEALIHLACLGSKKLRENEKKYENNHTLKAILNNDRKIIVQPS